MQLVKKWEQIGNIAFYIGISIHLLLMTIGYGEWTIPLHGRFMQLAFVLFGIKILTTYYSRKEWIAIFILGCLGALSYVATRDEYVISVIVMIFAAKSVDMRKVCKWIFVVSLLFTVVTAALSLLGIGGIPVDIRDYGRGGVEARWCLGFGHANNLHGTIWYLVALLVYLYFEKVKWHHYLLLTVLNIGLYMLTLSRAGMLTAQVLIVAACILHYAPAIGRQLWIYLSGGLCIVGAVILSLVSVTVPKENSTILQILDRFFTGRIVLAYQGANISNWRLLTHVGELGVVDNGWVTIFFNYGYLIGVLFVVVQIYLIYMAYKRKNGIYLTILVTNAFYTLMESTYTLNNAYFLCNLSYVVAMLMMGEKYESERFKGENKGDIFGTVG